MKLTLATLTGILVGITATTYCRRYAAAFLWWAFSRGDTP